MIRALLFSSLLTICAHPVLAKPSFKVGEPQPLDSAGPRLEFPTTMAKSAVDTTYLLGGPDRWDGSFETPGGQPDWHDWTHEDISSDIENHWHTSTYMADLIPGAAPGNFAMYCGDETIPACSAADSVGGYGGGWLGDIEWRRAVADPSQPVTVRLTGAMIFDTEPGYDLVYLIIHRGDEYEYLDFWDGQGAAALDYTTTVSPGEFTGPDSDEVQISWRFTGDSSWNDIDCLVPTRGACQIDDLSIYFDGNLVTFDDFEPGNPVNWDPVPFPGVGDFANLRHNLPSVHPCQSVNSSYQVNFIDDGLVVPGTGGTPCIDWCYGPGGWIVNNDGGLMKDFDQDFHLINQAVSPPLAWPAGNDAAELAFDCYFHQSFTIDNPGMGVLWFVRSTASSDPADLQYADWESHRNPIEFSSGAYFRIIDNVTELLVLDRKWVQIALMVNEYQFVFGWDGPNGTPAPYFDNVAFKVWDPVGPDIQVLRDEKFGDAFPVAGELDPVNLAANWCRIDMASQFQGARGDSLVARIEPFRQGAVLTVPPALHWLMKCNPAFDGERPEAPDAQGVLRGMALGSPAIPPGQTTPVDGRWAFDLPDTGFFFPGDRLRYYVTADDDLEGDVRTASWPPDTTGVLDFSTGSLFPYNAEIRALPGVTLSAPEQFAHPEVLLVDDSNSNPNTREVWLTALQDLGFQRDVDFEVLTLFHAEGIGMYLTGDILSVYHTIISSGGKSYTSLGSDEDKISDWLDSGGKKGIFCGDALAGYLDRDNPALLARLGVQFDASVVSDTYGGIWDLEVAPVSGNGVLPEEVTWQINAACPEIRWIDAIEPSGAGISVSTLDSDGSPGGPYSSVVTVDDQVLSNRTAVLPFDIDAVSDMTLGSAQNDKSYSASTYLAYYLLLWLGSDVASAVDDVPGAGRVTVSAHPNPFNPSTTIAFEIPSAAEVSLDIYDLQGRLVRRLLDESPYATGGHRQIWDGRDGEGRATASGVYFYRFAAGSEKRVGKLTLLK